MFICLIYTLKSFFTTSSLNQGKSRVLFKQQILYLFVLFVLELPFAVFVSVAVIKADIDPSKKQTLDWQDSMYSSIIHPIYYCRGSILCIIRFLEPGFLMQVKKYLYQCWTKDKLNRSKPESQNESDYDPNVLFLSSQLNNLIVCGILQGMV